MLQRWSSRGDGAQIPLGRVVVLRGGEEDGLGWRPLGLIRALDAILGANQDGLLVDVHFSADSGLPCGPGEMC